MHRGGLVPSGEQQEHPRTCDVVGEVLDERDGLHVCPVQILQNEHQAAVPCQPVEQPQDGLGEDDRRLVGHHRVRAELRQQAAERRTERAQPGDVEPGIGAQPGEQRLDHRPVRDGLPVADRSTGQHQQPGGRGRDLADKS